MFDSKLFYRALQDYENRYSHLRAGQATFNTMFSLYSEAAGYYRGSELDPFYNDNFINEFILACQGYINKQGG